MADQLTDTAEIQKQAIASGFRWASMQEVVDKCTEELEEVKEAFAEGDATHLREEIGDLMFMSVILCHYTEANPSDVLKEATDKFSKRFAFTKNHLEKEGVALVSATRDEKRAAWVAAKQAEKHEGL